jgi:non-heme chloroperoxidase
MPYVEVGTENSGAIEIYYEDHGVGSPVVLIHGYPLNGHSWEKQEAALLSAGHHVIAYDRRGFGASSQPSLGYDFDTFAADLDALLVKLDLSDVALVGGSMGTGEVTRYLGKYGSGRVSKAAMLAPLGPFLLKTADNPSGVDRAIFEDFMAAIVADRPAAMKTFLDNCYNIDLLGGSRVSDQAWQTSFNVAVAASAKATLDCVAAWLEDFREDVRRIDVPVLIVQGDDDRILPIASTSKQLRRLLRDVRSVVIEGGPHAICWTHAHEVNKALLEFLE